MLAAVQAFERDQSRTVTANYFAHPKAVQTEVKRLKTWISVRKDSSASPEVRESLLNILSKYYRLQVSFAAVRCPLVVLLNDLLDIHGEGGLVDSKGRAKIAKWLEQLKDEGDEEASIVSRWTIESVDEANHSVSMVNTDNPDEWREDFPFPEERQELLVGLAARLEKERVIVEVDERTRQVLSLRPEE